MKAIFLAVVLTVPTSYVVSADDSVVTQYVSFNDAKRAGYKFRESGDWAEAENALEQGFELAANDRGRSEIKQLLMTVYSKTDRPDQLFESAEYVAKHHPHPASVSLTISSLLNIVRLMDWEVKLKMRYEDALQKDSKDRIALKIMEKFEYLNTRNHAKRREYIDRVIALNQEEGKEINADLHRDRAFTLRLERKFAESAQAYEEIAELDEGSSSYSLMFAAENWQRAENKTKALKAAERADQMGPGSKARKSLYQWHRGLGEVFLYAQKREQAIKHLSIAKEDAPIDAYRDQCSELLDQATALN